VKKINFFQFFLLYKWITYFTSFPWILSTSNSDSVWTHGEVLLKTVIKLIFLYFMRSSYMQPCGWNYPRAVGQGVKKEVCFAHRILVFHFFSLFFFAHDYAWCHLQCDSYNLNVTRSIVLKFWVKALVNKRNSSSLIITNMEFRFEPCAQLDLEVRSKRPKKKEKTI
jgi:hypothetical protein